MLSALKDIWLSHRSELDAEGRQVHIWRATNQQLSFLAFAALIVVIGFVWAAWPHLLSAQGRLFDRKADSSPPALTQSSTPDRARELELKLNKVEAALASAESLVADERRRAEVLAAQRDDLQEKLRATSREAPDETALRKTIANLKAQLSAASQPIAPLLSFYSKGVASIELCRAVSEGAESKLGLSREKSVSGKDGFFFRGDGYSVMIICAFPNQVISVAASTDNMKAIAMNSQVQGLFP